METKIKGEFKAVDFMREVRNELSQLYHLDKQRYHDELKQSMNDFLNRRQKLGSESGTIKIKEEE